MKYILIAIALIIAIIFLIRGCNGCFGKRVAQDTVSVTRDTIWVKSKSDTVYTPKIVKTIQYVQKIVTRVDSLIEFQNVDTSEILADYFATNIYSDTIKAKYGTILISDTVSRNEIQSRGVKTEFSVPVVKETITLTQPKRAIFYVGCSVSGNQDNLFYGAGWDLSLKQRNDVIFGAGVRFLKSGITLYEAQVKFPIRLRK